MELKFAKTHEWLRPEQDGTAVIGITDYAQEQLGDIVFVDIPSIGEELAADDIFGYLEAVKTVADLYLPVDAKVLEANPALSDEPQLVNQSPYDKGWLVRIELSSPSQIDALMSKDEYEKMLNKC
jgi:glycine cleavage system H protein